MKRAGLSYKLPTGPRTGKFNMESRSSSSSPSSSQQSDPRAPLLGNCDPALYAATGVPHGASSIQAAKRSLTEHAGSPTQSDISVLPTTDANGAGIRTYLWRWVVLAIFFLNLGVNNMLWISIAPVADVMRCYYGISNTWVNTTTTVYMATYVLFFLPCAWFLDRYGLRATMVLASVTNALGAAVRVAGTGAQYFGVLLGGQTIASLCNVLIWGAGSHLSEVWFPASERATATAISSTISPNFGVLLGLALSPVIIHQPHTVEVCGNETYTPSPSPALFSDWSGQIQNRMFYYLLGQAVISLIILFFTLVAFRSAPPTPPSLSRQLESANKHERTSGCQQLQDFVTTSLLSLKNVYFLMYLVVAGIMLTMAGTVVSVLNEVIVPFFPGHDEQIAYLGMVTQVVTVISGLILSRVLDYTKAYYAVNLFVSFSSAASVAVIVVLILYQKNFYLLYLGTVFLGTSISSVQAVCYEFAVEMTYPLSEGVSAGLINFVSQLLSVGMIFFVGAMSQNVKHVSWGLWTIFATTALGALIAVFVKPELRRVKIDKKE